MTGNELRIMRKAAGVTQDQLAHAIERDAITVSRWECDRPRDIGPMNTEKVRTAIKMARIIRERKS